MVFVLWGPNAVWEVMRPIYDVVPPVLWPIYRRFRSLISFLLSSLIYVLYQSHIVSTFLFKQLDKKSKQLLKKLLDAATEETFQSHSRVHLLMI